MINVGIIGCGFVGGALKDWLEHNNPECKLFISDPPKGYNDDLSNKLENYEQKIKTYEQQNGELKESNQKLRKNINNLTKEYDKIKVANGELIANFTKLKDIVMKTKIDLNNTSLEKDKLLKDKKRLKLNLEMFVNENKEAAKCIENLTKEIEDLNSKSSGLINDKERLLLQCDNLERINTKLNKKIEILQIKNIEDKCFYESGIALTGNNLTEKCINNQNLLTQTHQNALSFNQNPNDFNSFDPRLVNSGDINIKDLNLNSQNLANNVPLVQNSQGNFNSFNEDDINLLNSKIISLETKVNELQNELNDKNNMASPTNAEEKDENYMMKMNEYETIIRNERDKMDLAEQTIFNLRKQIEILRRKNEESDANLKEGGSKDNAGDNAGVSGVEENYGGNVRIRLDKDNPCLSNALDSDNHFSGTDENEEENDNVNIKEFTNELHNQINNLNDELENVKEQNKRLMNDGFLVDSNLKEGMSE